MREFVARWPDLGHGDSKEYVRYRLKQIRFHLVYQKNLKDPPEQPDFELSWHLSLNFQDASFCFAS